MSVIEKYVARPSQALDLVHEVDAETEELVACYLSGSCFVPRDLWPLVKKHRELSTICEAGDSSVAEAQCNALNDALLILVAGRVK